MYVLDMDAQSGHVGYVPQMDSMLPFLTVKETLVHSALTRLPKSWSHKRRSKLISYAIDVLGLRNIVHTLVGESGSAGGLTMGQRKCVSIAVELVANPSVLIADEPTTALDATSACEVLQCLRTVASEGKNVIAVIHQPRQEIYDMFDDVLLIGVGGRTVFLGSRELVLPYFEDVLKFSCPEKTNPPDFFLDVLSGKMGAKGRDMSTPWIADGPNFLKEHGTSDDLGEKEQIPEKTKSVLRPTLAFQYVVFLLRCVRQWKDFKRIVMACFTHFLAGFICGVSFSKYQTIHAGDVTYFSRLDVYLKTCMCTNVCLMIFFFFSF
jgi:ABC-type multidrug transport system ATPase subunit